MCTLYSLNERRRTKKEKNTIKGITTEYKITERICRRMTEREKQSENKRMNAFKGRTYIIRKAFIYAWQYGHKTKLKPKLERDIHAIFRTNSYNVHIAVDVDEHRSEERTGRLQYALDT